MFDRFFLTMWCTVAALTGLVLSGEGAATAREYHVAVTGDDAHDGEEATPLKTISAAAAEAQPGDTITVHEGVYRERINPPRGGTSDDQRIVYQAAPGEKVTIKGSERVTGWEKAEGDVWKLTLPNSFFGDFNPYKDLVHGAWYEARRPYHTGAVYLNGHWLREAARKSDVIPSEEAGEEDAAEELMNLASIYASGSGTIQAASFLSKSHEVDVIDLSNGETCVGPMQDGSFLSYELDFGEASKNVRLYAASPIAGGVIELRKNSPDGEFMGRCDVGFTAEWTHFQVFHCQLPEPVSGRHTVYLVFKARSTPKQDSDAIPGFWFAEVDNEAATIWADFKGEDPTKEMVEINVRQTVFYPSQQGVNYITVRGFTLEQAATPWSTPTAEQIGLIGTHWSKGWVIENNTIRYSVCTAVTLGKYGDDNDHTYDYRAKTIPDAVENGWNRDTVGHHLVKDNHIYNCGQAGVEGSMGCSFSTIAGNEIHDIRKDHQYGGCETAGIKFHGAVDVVIKDNHIYNCEHWGGIWLDWMAQGARLTGNLLHDNSQDLMIEVNHGPHLVDNNLLLSRKQVTEASGGGAFVHNLWFGDINIWPDLKVRLTPYFKPHSIDIVGSIDVNQDDDRYLNNLFVGPKGTSAYDEHEFAITAAGNVFLSGSKPSKQDQHALVAEGFDPGIELHKKNDGWWLDMNVDPSWQNDADRPLVTSEQLGRALVPDAPFEHRDGTPYRIDTDYFGEKRTADSPAPGPFRYTGEKTLHVKVWPKD